MRAASATEARGPIVIAGLVISCPAASPSALALSACRMREAGHRLVAAVTLPYEQVVLGDHTDHFVAGVQDGKGAELALAHHLNDVLELSVLTK